MQAYFTLTRRELGSFFYSWTGYIVVAGAVFLMGLSFVTLLDRLAGEATPMPMTELFLNLCFWIIVLFSAPVITMRLIALEKHTGTFETLMTAPVGESHVVLAKFTAALIFYMILWLPLLGCVFILRYFARGPNMVDAGTLGGTYVGIFLIGCLYMAAGCLASAMTRNQIVAAMVSFVIGLGFFLAGFMGNQLPLEKTWMQDALNCVGIVTQMKDYALGVVDTRSVVFCLTTSAFFLFLACRVLESRRWK